MSVEIHLLCRNEGRWYVDDLHGGIIPWNEKDVFEGGGLLLCENNDAHLPEYLHRQVVITHLEEWAKQKQDQALFVETFGPKKPNSQKRPFSLWNFLCPVETNRAHMSTTMYGEEFVTEKIKNVMHFFGNMSFAWWVTEEDDPLWIKILLKAKGFRCIDFVVFQTPHLSSMQQDFLRASGLVIAQDTKQKPHSFCLQDDKKRIFLLGYFCNEHYTFFYPKDPNDQDNAAHLLAQTFFPSQDMAEVSLCICDGDAPF